MSLFNRSLLEPLEQVVVMQLRIGRNVAATDGACHCFSLRWLSEILRNAGGLAQNRMATISRGSGGANLILQKMFATRWGGATEWTARIFWPRRTADCGRRRRYAMRPSTSVPSRAS